MNAKCEQMVCKLVSRYFKRAGEEIVSPEVMDALMYEKQFARLSKEERTEIALEAVSRLEGEFGAEDVIENITFYEDYQKYFALPCGA